MSRSGARTTGFPSAANDARRVVPGSTPGEGKGREVDEALRWRLVEACGGVIRRLAKNEKLDDIPEKLRAMADAAELLRQTALPGLDTEPRREAESDAERAKRRREREAAIVRVFETWRRTMQKTSSVVLTPPRRALIAQRLDTYGEETVLRAIAGCAQSPHNMGRNDDGVAWNDLELILRVSRTGNNVERFAALALESPLAASAGRPRTKADEELATLQSAAAHALAEGDHDAYEQIEARARALRGAGGGGGAGGAARGAGRARGARRPDGGGAGRGEPGGRADGAGEPVAPGGRGDDPEP